MANKRYKIRSSGRSIEVSKPNHSILVYRIPYQNLKGKNDTFEIENPFIVYILLGRNENGKDVIYVGKSKNGIKNRPTAHNDKWSSWEYCFILTQFKERTFFNDGTIQYIEDKISSKVDSLNKFKNTTVNTNTGTANTTDVEDCDEYIEEAYQILDILGLDLTTVKDETADLTEDNDDSSASYSAIDIPDGVYSLSRKIKRENKIFTAKMQIVSGKCIVLKGSMVCKSETMGMMDYVINKRNNAAVENGILQEDVILDSPSAAGSFVIGGACNGWQHWKCDDGSTIDKFRKPM